MSKEIGEDRNLFPITQKYLNESMSLEEFLKLDVRSSQIHPVLTDIIQGLVSKKDVISLLRNYEKDRFCKPSSFPQREIMALSSLMYEEVPDSFEDIDLSPVAPLGTNSILTKVSQKSVLSTVRNTEVLADPTAILALETARKRREYTKGSSSSEFMIDLCTSVRCIRGQIFSEESGFTPHFQIFAMSSGGIASQERIDSKIIQHTMTYLDFLQNLKETRSGYFMENIEVKFSDINIAEILIDNMDLDRNQIGKYTQNTEFDFFKTYGIELPKSISSASELDIERVKKYELQKEVASLHKITERIETIRNEYPEVNYAFDMSRIAGIGYYNGPCFNISASNRQGARYPLADGGYSDWLSKLLSNGKVKYFSSGFGLELFGKNFKA